MIRVIQRALLLIGSAALGFVVCGLGLACLAAVTIFRTRPGHDPSLEWGAAFAFPFCGLGGGTIGAIAGVVGAKRLMEQRGDQPWKPATWLGVALGVAAALAIRYFGLLGGHVAGDLIRWWPGMATFLVASGTLGGIVGGLLGSLWERRRPARDKKRKRVHRAS